MPRHHAFTLIELLVVISVMAVLAGLLLASLGVVRRSAAETQATHTVQGLGRALEAYRLADPRQRYPLETELHPRPSLLPVVQEFARLPTGTLATGLLGLLDDGRYLPPATAPLTDGRALDPWGNAYRYFLRWPVPTDTGFPPGMPTHAQHAAWAATRNPAQPPFWNWLPSEDVNADGQLQPGEDLDGSTTITEGLPARWWRNRTTSAPEPGPFPYVLSLGRRGDWSAPDTWIYQTSTGAKP
jgi:prepilin-type N-terminal cleavage/methylation domain-containing protein